VRGWTEALQVESDARGQETSECHFSIHLLQKTRKITGDGVYDCALTLVRSLRYGLRSLLPERKWERFFDALVAGDMAAGVSALETGAS